MLFKNLNREYLIEIKYNTSIFNLSNLSVPHFSRLIACPTQNNLDYYGELSYGLSTMYLYIFDT